MHKKGREGTLLPHNNNKYLALTVPVATMARISVTIAYVNSLTVLKTYSARALKESDRRGRTDFASKYQDVGHRYLRRSVYDDMERHGLFELEAAPVVQLAPVCDLEELRTSNDIAVFIVMNAIDFPVPLKDLSNSEGDKFFTGKGQGLWAAAVPGGAREEVTVSVEDLRSAIAQNSLAESVPHS